MDIWLAEDVEQYVSIGLSFGKREYAAFLLVEYELGQRLNDMYAAGLGNCYFDGDFYAFYEQKARKWSDLPISDQLKDRLADIGLDPNGLAFMNQTSGVPMTRGAIRYWHEKVQLAAMAQGGRRLVLHKLRHTVVAEALIAGATVPGIASLTGHSERTVYRIIRFYFPRDARAAVQAQKKRGRTFEQQQLLPVQTSALVSRNEVYSTWSALNSELKHGHASLRRLVATSDIKASVRGTDEIIEGVWSYVDAVVVDKPIAMLTPSEIDSASVPYADEMADDEDAELVAFLRATFTERRAPRRRRPQRRLQELSEGGLAVEG